MYRLYQNRLDSFLDISSLGRVAPWWTPRFESFWALRDITFSLRSGSRLGVIGRNGAGKTTLLKLITGNVAPSEGSLQVHGEVQALLEAGAGFHPEFTGYENVEASLIQNGMTWSEIKRAVDEIADFTELGDFLKQPFKTYSAGMQARLVFTTATAIRPDILIVDEILGAGDAYFAVKSRSRMKSLVDSGASILLVSHAFDQILQLCEESIWIERGRIIMRGPSMEVIKAYEEFIHDLEDKRLKSANRQRNLGFRDAVKVEQASEVLGLVLSLAKGSADARVDFQRAALTCNSIPDEIVRIGDPQDSNQVHMAYLISKSSDWSDPKVDQGVYYRSLLATVSRSASGEIIFRSFPLEATNRYSFRLRYRTWGECHLTVTVYRNGVVALRDQAVPLSEGHWSEFDIDLAVSDESGTIEAHNNASPGNEGIVTAATNDPSETTVDTQSGKRQLRRWQGEGDFLVDDVVLIDEHRRERSVFQVGSNMAICIGIHATRAGTFPIIYAIAIFRIDGIKITQHVSDRSVLSVAANERHQVALEFPSLDLADGRYVISVSLHRVLDPRSPEETIRYDLIDRSFEFEIVGNVPLRTSLFVLPARWNLAPEALSNSYERMSSV